MGNSTSWRFWRVLLLISQLTNIYCVREIIKYEPDGYKNRHYYGLKQKGWFDKQVDLSELKKDSTLILLTLGQSNAANSSNAFYKPRSSVMNYYNGHLYMANEPLIGAGGSGGSVWTILADKLIDSGLCRNVVIVPIAVGSTTIEDWASGECYQKLITTLNDLKKHSIQVTHILWHQGEGNNGTSRLSYKTNLSTILNTIRTLGQDAPFYCSIATYNFAAFNKPLGIDTALQNAQREFVVENKSVLMGPNTDKLIYAIDRFDGQHFSKYGNQRYAMLWFEAIKKQQD